MPDSCRSPSIPPVVVPLWPGDLASYEMQPDKDDNIPRIARVTTPWLTFHRAARAEAGAPTAVVCPGGGYHILASGHEGTEIAAWLNGIGVHAAVLYYRVPGNRDGAFDDAQRAAGIVRQRSSAWGADPAKVGILGFSAGAHLAARLSNYGGTRTYARVDAADDLPCRPAFAALVYPAYLVTPERRVAPELSISRLTPPTWIVQAQDDTSFIGGTLVYHQALVAAGVPAEIHVFATGGHGYGMRPSTHPVSTWPALAGEWLCRQAGSASG